MALVVERAGPFPLYLVLMALASTSSLLQFLVNFVLLVYKVELVPQKQLLHQQLQSLAGLKVNLDDVHVSRLEYLRVFEQLDVVLQFVRRDFLNILVTVLKCNRLQPLQPTGLTLFLGWKWPVVPILTQLHFNALFLQKVSVDYRTLPVVRAVNFCRGNQRRCHFARDTLDNHQPRIGLIQPTALVDVFPLGMVQRGMHRRASLTAGTRWV